mgnify:CR=1 FL=1
MKNKIIRSEYAPGKGFLRLHRQGTNLVLEALGAQGCGPVGFMRKSSPMEVNIPTILESCTKKELVTIIKGLIAALSESNIIKIK